jgi:asparagine synthase (glutamine-hydrolysing)
MRAGFVVVSQDQGVELRFFGRRAEEPLSLVRYCKSPDGLAVLMGRLYYRDDLRARLGSRSPDGANDAALALTAYRHFGTSGIAGLEGDFALVIWDARRNCLIGSRDPLGGYPLFWTQSGPTSAFGTSLRPLLRRLPRQALNLDHLAEFLMLPCCSIEEPVSEGCAYEGVKRVVPGSMVRVQLATGEVTREVYWDWRERMVDPGTDRPEEIGPGYAELLRDAVRQRIHGRTASHLSGGMDSTSVSLLARDGVEAGHGEAPLHTLSLVYDRLPHLARETPYIDCALQGQRGIVSQRVLADGVYDFEGFTDPPPHDEPWSGLWRLSMFRALIDAAGQVGATTMLTGHGSDDLLALQPWHITDLLRRCRLRGAWAEACRWARAGNCSPWKVFYPSGLVNLLPAGARDGLGTWLRRGRAGWENQTDHTIPPWILPGFARRQALRGRALRHIRQTYFSCRPTSLSVALDTVASRHGDGSRWYLAASLGMVVTHPFLDPRLLCAGLGIQARVRAEPERQKPVLAEAMRGVLPDRIRNRRGNGNFNEACYLGLSRNLPRLEELVRQAPVEDLGLLDKDVLVRCLRQAALGIAANGMANLDRLSRTLSLLTWLSLEGRWQRTVGQPVQTIRAGSPGQPEARPSGPAGMLAEVRS